MSKNTIVVTDALQLLEQQILAKLEMLAEGSSSAYDRPNLHRAHPESKPPPHWADNGHLSPIRSLKEYHAAMLNKAAQKGYSARLMAIAEAEADYNSAIKRQPTFNTFDAEQNTADRDAAILVHFEGQRPEWPAAVMKCSCSHVEKLRRRSGRHAINGEVIEREAVA